MSAVPNAFNQGLAVAQGNLQIAGQNQQFKQAQAQQMTLAQQKMAQEQQMQQRELDTQTLNYGRMNASHERIAAAENAQRQSQYDQTMAYNREQAKIERLVSIRMKNIEMEQQANDLAIARAADNDPNLQAMRGKAIALKAEARNLEQTMMSADSASKLAQGVKSDRLAEVDATLQQYRDTVAHSADQAKTAFRTGLDNAIRANVKQGSYWDNVARVAADPNATDQTPGLPMGASLIANALGYGDKVHTMGPIGGAFEMIGMGKEYNAAAHIMADNIGQFFGSAAEPALVRAKASEFEKNGSFLAAQVVHSAMDTGGAMLGLDKGNQAKATQVMTQLVADAAVVAHVGKGNWSDAAIADSRRRIATGIKELRDAGMRDEHIEAIIDGLGEMNTNKSELLNHYAVDDLSGKEDLLAGTLSGVGAIHDAIQAVNNDPELMKLAGGKLVDHSKYDLPGTIKKAHLAYGMQNSPELQSVLSELNALGMSEKEIAKMAQLLVESDPRLQFLRPEEYARLLQQMGSRSAEAGAEYDLLQEQAKREQAGMVVEGKARNIGVAAQQMRGLEGLVG